MSTQKTINEKPILFNAEMVRAILNDRKTMTRRVIKNFWNISYSPWQKGMTLWVRETWADNIKGCPNGITYRADHYDPQGDGPANPIKWKPSIYMPRWASRITLEIVNVRVEQVQDISEEDAIAEGVRTDDPILNFSILWDSINKKYGFGWTENPRCRCILFRRIKS